MCIRDSSKTIASVVNSFFGTNALSQFMDQQNPLSEITHKRRPVSYTHLTPWYRQGRDQARYGSSTPRTG